VDPEVHPPRGEPTAAEYLHQVELINAALAGCAAGERKLHLVKR
jgi:hypothetical protein